MYMKKVVTAIFNYHLIQLNIVYFIENNLNTFLVIKNSIEFFTLTLYI